ncbi:MAG TPA: FG-GAP-like repeat-containing protein [Dongiaceae bacterium]|nr:FG-GAP-like repeat-containing protein [Dongiaceae bacterium]
MHRVSCRFFALVLGAALVGNAHFVAAQFDLQSETLSNSYPNSIAVGDFNHDGNMDFALASYYSFTTPAGIQIFLGRGDGTFKAPLSYAVASGAGPIAVADLNQDGNLDIVALATGSVAVFLGKGDGSFQAPVTYATPATPKSVAIGDFNNDGNLDIATANNSNLTVNCQCVSVLLGDGRGRFQEPSVITYPPYAGLLAIAAGNFATSKNLDLVVTLQYPSYNTAQVLLGNGDGTFRLGASYELQPASMSITGADLRKNGITDIVVAQDDGLGIAVLLGNGDGTFESPAIYDVSFSLGVAVGDVNGDGIPDLVAISDNIGSNGTAGALYVFRGNGDGTFKTPEIFTHIGQFPYALALADFNNDHMLDVAVDDQNNLGGEYTLLNTGTVWFSPFLPLTFKNQKHGTTSQPQVITLTNKAKTPLIITSMRTTGPFSATSTCHNTVAPNAHCTISVTFSPKTAGGFSGIVSIIDSASSKPQVISLTGTGT